MLNTLAAPGSRLEAHSQRLYAAVGLSVADTKKDSPPDDLFQGGQTATEYELVGWEEKILVRFSTATYQRRLSDFGMCSPAMHG